MATKKKPAKKLVKKPVKKAAKKPASVALKNLQPKKKPAMKSVAPQTVACKASPGPSAT